MGSRNPDPLPSRWESFTASLLLFTFLVTLLIAATHHQLVLWIICVAVFVFGVIFCVAVWGEDG